MAIKMIDNNEMKANLLAMVATNFISSELVVSDISYQYKTDKDGNRTDVIEYVKYSCVDTKTFSCIKVSA